MNEEWYISRNEKKINHSSETICRLRLFNFIKKCSKNGARLFLPSYKISIDCIALIVIGLTSKGA